MLQTALLKIPKYQVESWLFPAMLFAAFFQNYYDITAILKGGDLALYAYEGPLIYKIGKDIIYVVLFGAICFRTIKLRQAIFDTYTLALLNLIALMLLISAVANGVVIAAVGLRWIFPFVLFLLMHGWVGTINKESASRWIMAGMCLCLVAQIYQLFNMPPVFGELFPGIPARTPGIFIVPNSTAFFACASAACIMVFTATNTFLRAGAVVLATLISMLAQSGTGVIVSLILVLRALFGKKPALFWSLSFLTAISVFVNLNSITVRDNYIETSGGGRLEILVEVLRSSSVSLSNFGLFTNAANLLSDNPESQVATDSLLASWIGNFGLTAVIAVMLFAMFVYTRMRTVDWQHVMPCVIVFILFSMTTVVFEAFPMNIYLALGLWAAKTPSKGTQSETNSIP